MGFLVKFINYTYFADRACRHTPERVHNVDSKQRNSVVCVIKLLSSEVTLPKNEMGKHRNIPTPTVKISKTVKY